MNFNLPEKGISAQIADISNKNFWIDQLKKWDKIYVIRNNSPRKAEKYSKYNRNLQKEFL